MNRRVLITAGANGIGLVMARAFAALGDRVRVTDVDAVAEGLTPDALRQGYAAGTALKRLTDPKDVADMAIYLASDGARMVAGQALAVDGMTYNVDP